MSNKDVIHGLWKLPLLHGNTRYARGQRLTLEMVGHSWFELVCIMPCHLLLLDVLLTENLTSVLLLGVQVTLCTPRAILAIL